MNWTNVKLILSREVRDQLRDRRTLFMIAVLPILLYPLLGMSFFQVAQFVQEHSTRVLVIGAEDLPDPPPLFETVGGQRRFAAQWFRGPDKAALLDVFFQGEEANEKDIGQEQEHERERTNPAASGEVLAAARLAVQSGEYEVVVLFPDDFAARLRQVRQDLADRRASPGDPAVMEEVPSPKVHYNTAREASVIAFARVSEVLARWTDQIGRDNLEAGGIPERAARPFRVSADDVADATGNRGAALWSKVLPFMLLIWALTGAFYPAIDLCAGEKERGTLETLLSSPAERREIVVGKLLAVMLFSVATAVLNLISMGITGDLILSQLPEFGPPPSWTPLWLVIALLPMSALFSAVCLALAAFARSSKEGQYYLMPVLLVTMPLVIMPMSPGFELNLGNSLIPVSGVVLLLRAMLEGTPWRQVLPFVLPVTAVTLACCLLAIRWAVDQFQSESVLFRESERFDLGLWLKHLMRDREDTPNVAAAAFCGVLVLMIRFFMGFALPTPTTFGGFATLAAVTQLAVVASPALLMTVMLTRSPQKTLLLTRPPLRSLPAAVFLAVTLHPLVNLLQAAVMRLYPVNDRLAKSLEQLLGQPHSLWQMLLAMAVIPAICEELAFRGFILSGLRHLGSKGRAIFLSSLLFALAHAIFQQSVLALLVGMVIGYLAVQTGSLAPCIVFHMVHNGLAVASGQLTPEVVARYPLLRAIVRDTAGQGYLYQPAVIAAAALAAAGLLWWFHTLRYTKSAEESLRESIERHAPHGVLG